MSCMGYGTAIDSNCCHMKSGRGSSAVLVSHLDVMIEIIGHPVVLLTLCLMEPEIGAQPRLEKREGQVTLARPVVFLTGFVTHLRNTVCVCVC